MAFFVGSGDFLLTEKPLYFKPRYAPRHQAVEMAMGHFLMTWGVLEGELDKGIAVVFDISTMLSLCISSNMGTKAKIDSLRSGISMHGEFLSQALMKRADKTLLKITSLSNEWRNTLAHGFPIDLPDDANKYAWHWGRQSARKQLDMTAMEMNPRRWRAATRDVKAVTKDWCRDYQRIWHVLAELTPEQRDLWAPPIKYR